MIADGVRHPGFSFIEIISDCPEYYGRYNKVGGGAEMLTWMARRDAGVAVPLSEKKFVEHVPSSAVPLGMVTGVLERDIRPVFTGVRKQEEQ